MAAEKETMMEGKVKKSFSDILVIAIAFFAMYTVGLIYMLVLYPIIKGSVDFWIEWLIRYAVIFLIGLPIFLLISRKKESSKIGNPCKVKGSRFFKYYILSLGAANVGGLIGNLLISLVTGVPITEVINYFDGGTTLGATLFLCLVPPIIEELFFRRILLKKLIPFGDGFAILGTAIAFSIYHTLLTHAQIIHIFLLGVLFSYVALRTKSIFITIALHSLVNLWSTFIGRIALLLPDPIPVFAPTLILPVMISFIVIVLVNRKKIIATIKGIFCNRPIDPLSQILS